MADAGADPPPVQTRGVILDLVRTGRGVEIQLTLTIPQAA
jgi:hypothetical protein